MKIVVAPDSFKGSLSAKEVADAVESGIRRYWPDIQIVKLPMADGGEGTLETILDCLGGSEKSVEVSGPLGQPVKARFGILEEDRTALIEIAAASGLTLVAPAERNPLLTSTYGAGELIRAALDEGCRRFIIGIGGSATNDGGAGMAQALGVRLLDESSREIAKGGGALGNLARIDMGGLDPRVRASVFRVASDVTNPLCGENGASRVFGPQKGATPEMVGILDVNLKRLAAVIKRDLGPDLENYPGAGAAGGLGAGLIAFCNAEISKGVELIVEITRLKQKMAGAALVITGEGQMDGQSSRGKTPYGVAMAAKGMGIPAAALVGSIGKGAEEMYQFGIRTIIPIVKGPQSLEECVSTARDLVSDAAERLIRAADINLRP